MINLFRLPPIEGSGAPNQLVGDLPHTIAKTELPHVRTELLQLLVIPSPPPHPEQPYRQLTCHGHLGNGMMAAHRQVHIFASPLLLDVSCAQGRLHQQVAKQRVPLFADVAQAPAIGAASMYLVFDRLTAPGGQGQKIAASLASADVGKKEPVTMDPEGGLHGKGGAKSLAKRAVVGVVSQQIADEAVEMATHAVAPYASVGLGLVILFGGHGNDVDLPQYSDLQVVFGRPITIPEPAATSSPNVPAESSNPRR